MIEIVIGGCGNQQSCIRRNQVQEPVTKVRSTKFINADELKGFWIRSYNGVNSYLYNVLIFLNNKLAILDYHSRKRR